MKLWLLEAKANLPTDDNPWEPWYDKSFGFVVRAETEAEARKIAHENAFAGYLPRLGDENRGEFLSRETAKTKQPWKNREYSTCVELTSEGDRGLVLMDFRAA